MTKLPIVLILDGDALARKTASLSVSDAGYPALQAANADQAIQLLEQKEIGVIFSDINIPGQMSCPTLCTYVRKRWPHIGLLLTSGVDPGTRLVLPRPYLFLLKPYRLPDVTFALDKLAM